MKSPQKWFNRIFKGASLATVAIAFQACYGAPRDFGMDQYIEGVVTNTEGEPLKDIFVSVEVNSDSIQGTLSDEEGRFRLYTERKDEYRLSFSDKNGNIQDKDTTLTDRRGGFYLNINLDKK